MFVYCLVITLLSYLSGFIPLKLEISHKTTQAILAAVVGFILSLIFFEIIPELFESGVPIHSTSAVIYIGLLTMILVERFFCFHHHEQSETCSDHTHHGHHMRWLSASVALFGHSYIAGLALGASYVSKYEAFIAYFFAIILHKPFDAITLSFLLKASGYTKTRILIINFIFSLAVPLGAYTLIALSGNSSTDDFTLLSSYLMAFVCGIFVYLSLSDLLPELQKHNHDKLLLSIALVGGSTMGYLLSHLLHG